MKKKFDFKTFLGKYAIYLVLLFELIFFSVTSPYFLSTKNFFNILKQVSIVGIMAAGMVYVILTGGVDLSVDGIIACTGIVCASLMLKGVPPVFAIIAALLIDAVIGVVNAFFTHEFQLNPMIVTIATNLVLKGIAYIITNAIPIHGFTESFKVIGQGYLFNVIPIPIVIMVVIYVIDHIVLSKTKFGQSIYGIGGNEEAVRLTGINIRKNKYIAYVLCSVICGIAGIVLLSRVNTAQPGAGTGYNTDVITGIVLGGVSMSDGEGKVPGVFAGVVVMAVLSNGMLMLDISEYWQWVTKGLVMLAAISYDRILKKGRK